MRTWPGLVRAVRRTGRDASSQARGRGLHAGKRAGSRSSMLHRHCGCRRLSLDGRRGVYGFLLLGLHDEDGVPFVGHTSALQRESGVGGELAPCERRGRRFGRAGPPGRRVAGPAARHVVVAAAASWVKWRRPSQGTVPHAATLKRGGSGSDECCTLQITTTPPIELAQVFGAR